MQVGLEASTEVGGRSQDGGAVSGEGFQVVGLCLFGFFPLQNLIYIPGQDAWVARRTSRSTRPHTPLRAACLARAP